MSTKLKIIAAIVVAIFVCLIIYLSQAQINVTEYEVVVDPVKITDNKTLHEVNGSLTLYVPIAVKKDGNIHEVMNNLTIYCLNNGKKVKCNPKVEIIDTEYGKALKIVTDRYTTIKGYYSHRTPLLTPYDYIEPSTLVKYNDVKEVYVYLNSSSNADYVKLKLRIETGTKGLVFIGHGSHYIWTFADEYGYKDWITLNEGWNRYPCICMII